MALTRSFPTQVPAGQPITDTRRTTAGLVVRNADGTPRPGVFPAAATPIVTGRASMGYDIAPFLAATSRLNTGVELISNDAVTLLAPAGYAAPQSNSRIDVIWVRSQFMQHADTNNDVVFGVTQGVAAPIPAKPAIPTGALELATATILSTTTTTATVVITQTFQYTASAGGAVWFRNGTDLATWTPADGALAYRIDSAEIYQRRAGAWKLALGDTGWVQIPLANGWGNFPGGAYQGAEACKVNGIVQVAGLVVNATPANANPGVVIGTLPVGMRPKAYLIFTVWANGGARTVEVGPNGNIVVGDTAISAIRTSLALSFRADQ